MMEVLIPNMRVPENCCDCDFEDNNKCLICKERVESIDRPSWCPLVEIPDAKE